VASEQAFQTGRIRGVLHIPAVPSGDGLVLTHGAGADSNTPLLTGLASAFTSAGLTVLRYDLPFRVARATGPPVPAHAAEDRAGIAEAVREMRRRVTGRVFAGGHSYGGRQTAMLAAEDPSLADGLLMLAYPLHPPRRRHELRTAFFPGWRIPAVFVHGSRDPFGLLDEMRAAIAAIPARVELVPVEGAGHDLSGAVPIAGDILARMLF
jgi:uncharacterized protein